MFYVTNVLLINVIINFSCCESNYNSFFYSDTLLYKNTGPHEINKVKDKSKVTCNSFMLVTTLKCEELNVWVPSSIYIKKSKVYYLKAFACVFLAEEDLGGNLQD